MIKVFPKFKYHKAIGAVLVNSAEEERQLGSDWKESLSDFGIETHPAAKPPERVLTVADIVFAQSKKTSTKKVEK